MAKKKEEAPPISRQRAQIIICKDTLDLVEWAKYARESAENFSASLSMVARAFEKMSSREAAKMLGIAPKQFDSVLEVRARLTAIIDETVAIAKTVAPIAARLNPDEREAHDG
jgi:hypothetical protein